MPPPSVNARNPRQTLQQDLATDNRPASLNFGRIPFQHTPSHRFNAYQQELDDEAREVHILRSRQPLPPNLRMLFRRDDAFGQLTLEAPTANGFVELGSLEYTLAPWPRDADFLVDLAPFLMSEARIAIVYGFHSQYEYQIKGIGGMLLYQLALLGQAAECEYAAIMNSTNNPVYHAFNFEICDTTQMTLYTRISSLRNRTAHYSAILPVGRRAVLERL